MNKNEAKKTISVFAIAAFLDDLGTDMIYPVWPMFVTTILGAPMSVLGLIDGLGDAISSISLAISGYLSDRIGKRKIFIWIGYLFGMLSRLGYGASTAWQYLIPLRALDRARKIGIPPRDAIIADISVRDNRARYFGFLRTMDYFGASCGAVICILFLKFLGYRKLFFLAALPSIVSAVLVLCFIKEKRYLRHNLDTKNCKKEESNKKFDNNFKLFLFQSTIFTLGSFSYSFLLIYAKELGLKTVILPILYLIFTFFASISSISFGKLADKIGRKNVLTFSYILWSMVCLSFIFSRDYLMIFLTFILYGLHKGSLEPIQNTFVSELAAIDLRASSLGGFQMLIGISALLASLIAGILWDKVNPLAPLYLSLVLTGISLLVLTFVKENVNI